MYERTAPGRGSGRGGRRNGKDPEEGGSRTLLVQLLVCLVLFLVVYAGKGAFPARLMEVREEVAGRLLRGGFWGRRTGDAGRKRRGTGVRIRNRSGSG